MLDEDSRAAALTDFGLATGAGCEALTTRGQLVGTLDYLAPERIRGEDATPASDVYSLGCVVFECVSGRPPFQSKRGMRIVTAVAHLEDEPKDPCADRSEPGSFGRAVNAALAKDPARRPRSGRDYADLLRCAC
jgi:eukaryotic-like serine/threonine-protein kinase